MFLFTDAVHKEKEKVRKPNVTGILQYFARCDKHHTDTFFSVQTGEAKAPANAHV